MAGFALTLEADRVIFTQWVWSSDRPPAGMTTGMQHAEKADFRAEVFRIASDFEKCYCTGAEQQIVDDFFVLQN